MVEVIGDVVQPSELKIPVTTTMPVTDGAIILSGAKLYFYDGTNPTLITSA